MIQFSTPCNALLQQSLQCAAVRSALLPAQATSKLYAAFDAHALRGNFNRDAGNGIGGGFAPMAFNDPERRVRFT